MMLIRRLNTSNVRSASIGVLRSARNSSSASMLGDGVTSEQFCMDVVKEADYDNYLCGLLHPKDARRGFFAVRAFNCEIARIKDNVHNNAMTGAIRFQWWNDQIEAVFQGHDPELHDHPLVRELGLAHQRHNLTKRFFQRCIEARQRDMNAMRVETLDELEDYTEGAHSSILYLLLEVLGVRNKNADYCASHIGVCAGLTTLLRGTAFHATRGAIYLPRETAGKVNLVDSVLLKGPQTESEAKALQEAVFDVASQANGHLDRARLLMKGEAAAADSDASAGNVTTTAANDADDAPVPREAIYAFMPAVRAAMLLEDLQTTGFNPFDTKIMGEQPALSYQLKLLRTIMFKSF